MTNTIDVCVLGNAVVDGFARVSEELLSAFQLTKGDVAHLDHESFMRLNDEVMIEHFAAGGSAANVGHTLAQLGLKVMHMCRVGEDPAGQHLCSQAQRVGMRMSRRDETVRTFQIFVLLTPDGERTFVEPHTTALLQPEWVQDHWPEKPRWLVVEGYLLLDQADAVFAAIQRARQQSTQIALLAPPPAIIDKAAGAFKTVLTEGVDILFSDHHEAAALQKMLAPEKAAVWENLTRVETHGAEGVSYQKSGEETLWMPCPEILKQVDVTGAGEAFAAGFLYGLLKKEPTITNLGYGHQLAGRVVQQLGARLDNVTPDMLHPSLN